MSNLLAPDFPLRTLSRLGDARLSLAKLLFLVAKFPKNHTYTQNHRILKVYSLKPYSLKLVTSSYTKVLKAFIKFINDS